MRTLDYKSMPAIVTGGASGLGAATARALAARGARVVVLDSNHAAALSLAKEIGGTAASNDVADANAASAVVDRISEEYGCPRLLVNCAGIGAIQPLATLEGPSPLEDLDRVIRVNLIGVLNMSRLVVARMLKADTDEHGERGMLINVASGAAYEPMGGGCLLGFEKRTSGTFAWRGSSAMSAYALTPSAREASTPPRLRVLQTS